MSAYGSLGSKAFSNQMVPGSERIAAIMTQRGSSISFATSPCVLCHRQSVPGEIPARFYCPLRPAIKTLANLVPLRLRATTCIVWATACRLVHQGVVSAARLPALWQPDGRLRNHTSLPSRPLNRQEGPFLPKLPDPLSYGAKQS